MSVVFGWQFMTVVEETRKSYIVARPLRDNPAFEGSNDATNCYCQIMCREESWDWKSILCMLYVAGTKVRRASRDGHLKTLSCFPYTANLLSSRGFKVSSRSEFYANAPLVSNFLIRCTHLDQFNSLTDQVLHVLPRYGPTDHLVLLQAILVSRMDSKIACHRTLWSAP